MRSVFTSSYAVVVDLYRLLLLYCHGKKSLEYLCAAASSLTSFAFLLQKHTRWSTLAIPTLPHGEFEV
jgi:hypothetical protein